MTLSASQGSGPAAGLSIAIVGAGPSGFYAAEALLKMGATVALIERLPTPFGLVRYGVAPDHQKLKLASLAFEKVAQMPGFHFFGGIEVGKTISVSALRVCFHAVVFAHGASDDKKLGVPGESLPGSHTAAAFVAWYNGHPDYRDSDFDLSGESAVIIGNGNVALDIARILAKPVDALKQTDIAGHALEKLAESRIRHIHIVGRRGPGQARFSPRELAEIGNIEGCDALCSDGNLTVSTPVAAAAAAVDPIDRDVQANLSTFQRFASFGSGASSDRFPGRRTCEFHFFKTPRSINGQRRVESVTFDDATSENSGWTVPTGMVVRAVGYRGRSVQDLPFDEVRGIVPTVDHRVVDAVGRAVAGFYATGWIKRGPTGIIGHNRADSVAVVKQLLEDLAGKPKVERGGVASLRKLLSLAGHHGIDFAQWQQIDRAEVLAGRTLGKPREKFTRIAQMMDALAQAPL